MDRAGMNMPPSPQGPPPPSFQDFVSRQSDWAQRLLDHTRFLTPFEEFVEKLQMSLFIVAAGDGSVKNQQGAFGWVIADPNGEFLVEGQGPAYGTPMDSFRAEGYGLLSILTFLKLVEQ